LKTFRFPTSARAGRARPGQRERHLPHRPARNRGQVGPSAADRAGHEACGIVEETGSDVRRVKPGDRVLASVSPACGGCWWCVNGMPNHCELNAGVKAVQRFKLPTGQTAGAVCGVGTFAEAMVVHEASLVPVRTDLIDTELALLGCGVTTGLGAALITAQVAPGSSVAVIGCGGVGQSVIQGARIAGAAVIIAVDPMQARREGAAPGRRHAHHRSGRHRPG
jgi:S-(hydroxymethyl)glutathione dehydrogenase/alcohol dehydrogenase